MTLSLQAVFFLLGAIQGLILSVSILFKSHLRKEANKVLVAFILILTFQILLKVISKDWIGNYFSAFGLIAYQFPFLFGPMAYLFVKFSINEKATFRIKDILHFIPFIIPVFFIILILTNDVQWVGYFLPNSWMRGSVYVLIQLAMMAYYSFLSFRLCRQYESRSKVYFSNLDKVRVTWLNQFTVASLIAGSAVAITLFLMYNLYPLFQEIRYILLLQGILIYWISYTAMSRPGIFALEDPEAGQNENEAVMDRFQLSTFKKYAHNNLSEEDAIKIKSRVVNKMEEDRLYLNPDLTIDEFSKIVQESKHDISRVINEKLKVNFFDFINGYRVSAAKQLLMDKKMNHYTIAAIAFECGFSSVSSFNIVFKKFESITPSAFKKQKQDQTKVA